MRHLLDSHERLEPTVTIKAPASPPFEESAPPLAVPPPVTVATEDRDAVLPHLQEEPISEVKGSVAEPAESKIAKVEEQIEQKTIPVEPKSAIKAARAPINLPEISIPSVDPIAAEAERVRKAFTRASTLVLIFGRCDRFVPSWKQQSRSERRSLSHSFRSSSEASTTS